MAPLRIRLVEVDARPDAIDSAVHAAALAMALRWACDVRVRNKSGAVFIIRSRDAQEAAQLLAEHGVERMNALGQEPSA